MTLPAFLKTLEAAGLTIQVDDVLDILWLAQQDRELTIHHTLPIPAQANSPPAPSLPTTPGRLPTDLANAEPPKIETTPQTLPGTTEVYAAGGESKERIKASPVVVPAGHALNRKLALGRAMRPFRRHWASRHALELDEQQTVEKSAENKTLYPVFRPVAERWFDVDVVLEDDSVILVWQDVMRDFCQMLRQTGAFRNVRRWRLRLEPRAMLESVGARSPVSSLAGGTRRLVFFATHGSSRYWSDGSYARLLQTWSRFCSLVLLQLQPLYRWKRTALGEPSGHCAALEPGIPAAQLQVNLNWWSMAGVSEPQALVSLPIALLDSTALGEFALMQMAHGRRSPVAILDPAAAEADVLPQIREKSDIARTLALLREMSPSAFQLAIYLSPGAFTLPVARLVQEAMFGAAADQAHLADVLLSGLLSQTSTAPDVAPDGANDDPNSVYYRFLPEARETLLRSLREADARQLAQWLESYVSRYIEEIYGRTITFQGLVPDENGAYDLPAWAQPFARLSVSLLGLRAGGRPPNQIVQEFQLASSPGTVAQVARAAAASSGRSFPRALLGETISRQLEQAGIVRQDSEGSLRFLPGVEPLLAAHADTQTLLGVRILWVDDNPGRHEQQRLQLQYEGASIELGRSTEDGLRALRPEAFDVLITDLNRPFEGPLAGLEFIRQVKQNAASAVVVYSTVASQHETEAIALGALVASDNFDHIRQILAAHFRDRDADPAKNEYLRPSQTQALQQILQEWELPDGFPQYLAFQASTSHWQEVWSKVRSHENLARRVVHLVTKVFDCRTVQFWMARQRGLELAAAVNDVEANPFSLQFAREAISRRETLCEMPPPTGSLPGHSHLLLGIPIAHRDAQPVAVLVLSLDLERKLPLGPSQRRWLEIMAATVSSAWQRLLPDAEAPPETEAAATAAKTDSPPPRAKRFRVALAFPADKRPFVDTVAHLLAERFGEAAILYDKFHQAEFARSDLSFRMGALYHDEAELVVVFLTDHYEKKPWLGLEWNSIYDLLKGSENTKVMLCRFDRAVVLGLSGLAGFVELDDRTPGETATLILERLALNEGRPREDYVSPTRPKPDWPEAVPPMEWPIADRHIEREIFTQLVTRDARLRVLFITGPSGTGKTRLATLFQFNALRMPGIACGLLDFKGTVDLEVGAFAERLDLPPPAPGRSISLQLGRIFASLKENARPTLLIFDTFEAAGEAEHWVKEQLLPSAANSSWLRVIIAGQRVPDVHGQVWETISSRLELSVPTPEEWFEYARSKPGITLEFAKQVHTISAGNSAILAQILGPDPSDGISFSEQARILQTAQGDPALLALTAVDLKFGSRPEIDRVSIKDALLAAAVPHWCDPLFLAALLETTPGDSTHLFDDVRTFSVIESFPPRGERAVRVHQSARLALREHLRTTDPSRLQLLSAHARAYVKSSSASDARIEALYHLFAIDQPAAAAECEALHREFTEYGREEASHALAVTLNELTTVGWLSGAARVEALLAQLEFRNSSGETAQLENGVREVLNLAQTISYQSGVGRSQRLLGDVLKAKGRLHEALSAFHESLAIAQRLASADPSNADWQRDLAVAHARVGHISEAQGRLDEALSAFHESLAIAQRLASADPSNADWQRDLAVAHARVGHISEAQGRLDEALSAFHESLAIAQRLVSVDPSNADWQRDLAVAHARVGHISEAQGRLDEALSAFHESLAIAQRLASADPSNADWQRDLAVAHARVGHISEAQGRLDEALSAFHESLAIAQRLVSVDPSNGGWQRDLAVAHARVGHISEAQGRLDEALSAFHESLAIAQRLASADPSNADWQRDLAVAHARVGHISEAQGRLDEALSAFHESLAIAQRLVSVDPSNGGWQRDLAVAHARVGHISEAQGRLDEALSAFHESLAIAQRLASADPSNGGWQRDLAVAHSKVGLVLRRMGREQEAIQSLHLAGEV